MILGAYLLRGATHFVRYVYQYEDEDYEEPPPVEDYEAEISENAVENEKSDLSEASVPIRE